ncbi:transposase [Oceanimonas sp. MB9]|uniref:REP-associated tyrosine transposase n=1 Tax=Oceanimonas sp. MB9 TaxID=2588453 RepID=UPI0013F5C3C8|nr:transposase [Oceanimonas sp. MB9]NHI00795.1 REP-associated tyrosine transposase [Oceanimonas sp. MB9]
MQYRRMWRQGGTFFFTVTLADRRRALLTEHITLLREAFRQVKRRHPFELDAIVVLPEHLHALMTLPEGDTDYAKRWHLIKSGFSRRLPTTEWRSDSRQRRRERGIWQRRYWEHLIRNERDFRHHVDYIHYNPVKHGYVNAVKDWPYSSFHRYVRAGLLPEDWAGLSAEQATRQYGE